MVRLSFISLALGRTFLVKSPWISAFFWIAIVRDVRFPIFAIVGLVIADGVAWALRIGEPVKRSGALRNNAILVSIAVAWLTTASGRPLEAQLAVEVGAALAASLIAAAFVRGLRDSILPPLGWGFYLVAGVLFTLFPTWTKSALEATVIWPRPVDALGWLESFFQSLGMMLFLPKVEVGILVAVAIVLWSRVMFLCGLVGWICGVGVGLVLEQMGLTYLWLLAAHNYFLAAMLLGSVLFLPNRGTVFIAVAAGVAAAFLTAYFQSLFPGSAFAFLPVPAALTVWLGVGALLLSTDSKSARQNFASGLPPELAGWNAAYTTERFGHGELLFTVPVAGPVQITQGFDGQLSHIGRWRHALDFQRPMPAAAGVAGPSIWEAPVYSPAAGIVESVRNDVPDNPLGISNFAEMWGNHVIVRLDAGGWAMLAHLRQGSVVVLPGMRVEFGTYLGQVGNSGRSPTPHLHLHAQVEPAISASTRPFRLANFLTASDTSPPTDLLRWNAAAVPAVGAVIAGALPNPCTHAAVTTMAPGTTVWQVESTGRVPRAFARYQTGSVVRVRIFLDEFGRHLFKSYDDGLLVTYNDPDAWRLIEVQDADCPLLKLMALGAPCIPYAATKGMSWLEPVPLPPTGLRGWLKLLALPYRRRPFSYLLSVCTAAPDEFSNVVTVETKPLMPRHAMPTKVICHVERLRGPVKIEAYFENEKITFSLFSFEPGLPFERREKSRG